jgi:hypothetical protein
MGGCYVTLFPTKNMIYKHDVTGAVTVTLHERCFPAEESTGINY